jgi:NhaA family Na+:H+ antiporter
MADEKREPNGAPRLPSEPIDRLIEPITSFLNVEAASGVVLLACTITALVLANSPLDEWFLGLWATKFGFQLGSFQMLHSLKHWINDGLMAIFFFVIGLEVKRELVLGELRDARGAALPIAAALGGMLFPAGIYLALQGGEPGARGWGIPMATDIAFVVGCMAVLGPRIPRILRVMLLSLAIVDDIGAILVIAIGYTDELSTTALLLAFLGIGFAFALSRIGVRSVAVYTAVGLLVWLAFHESGVHATIAGVILGLLTPAHSYVGVSMFRPFLARASAVFHGDEWETESHRAAKVRVFQRAARETISPLEYLEDALHPWVGFVIMPIFALANAGVPLRFSDFADPVALAVMAGLVVGKPLGILLLSWLVVKLFLRRLPEGLRWGALLGGGFLVGIGFTMALFIADLALEGPLLSAAKVGIIGGSVLSAIAGMVVLIVSLPKPASAEAARP